MTQGPDLDAEAPTARRGAHTHAYYLHAVVFAVAARRTRNNTNNTNNRNNKQQQKQQQKQQATNNKKQQATTGAITTSNKQQEATSNYRSNNNNNSNSNKNNNSIMTTFHEEDLDLEESVTQQMIAEDAPLTFSSNNMRSQDFATYVFGVTIVKEDESGQQTKQIENRVQGVPHKMTYMDSKTVPEGSTLNAKDIMKVYKQECKEAALDTLEKLQKLLEPFSYDTKLMYDNSSLNACAKNSHAKNPSASSDVKDYFNRLSIPNQEVFIPGQIENKIYLYCSRCFKLPKHKQSRGRPNQKCGMEQVTMRQVAEIEMIWTLPGQWEKSDRDYHLYFGDKKLPDGASEEVKDKACQLKVRCDFIVHNLWPHDYGCSPAKYDADGPMCHCKYDTWEDLTHRYLTNIKAFGWGMMDFDFPGVFGSAFDKLNENLYRLYSNPLETTLPGKRISFGNDNEYTFDDRTYVPLPSTLLSESINTEHQVHAIGSFLLYFMNKFSLTFMFGTDYAHRNVTVFARVRYNFLMFLSRYH